jgi:hypothetical protein
MRTHLVNRARIFPATPCAARWGQNIAYDDLFLQIEVKYLGETDASPALIACIPGKMILPIWAILKPRCHF